MRWMRRLSTLCLGLCAMIPALACASSQRAGGGREPSATEVCFDARRVRSFSPLHEMYVYVLAEHDKHYLLTMDRYCFGLPFAIGIEIASNFGRVCSSTRARVTYQDSGVPRTCGILKVEAVASKEEAEKLVEDRTKPRVRG